MKILIANKFWYQRGGLERVMFDEIRSLEAHGHQVGHFSTSHPLNDPSPYSEYFAPYLELGAHGGLSVGRKAQAAIRMFNNRKAASLFGTLLDDFEPDLVHVHGIHRQLSPSILLEARRRGIHVVQSVHDLHHVCPGDTPLYREGRFCDRTGSACYWGCIRHRCVRGSLSASALSVAESSWQATRRVYERTVARFISPSQYLADRMIESGWTIPFDVVPNAVPVEERRQDTGDGFVIISRLACGKGVDVALAAAQMAGVEVSVAGTGPLESALRQRYPQTRFMGHLGQDQVRELVRGARAVVVPSEAPENAPMSILESMACGVPVVATCIGGIPELIDADSDGILVAPGDLVGLSHALRALQDDPVYAARLGSAARDKVDTQFTPDGHYQRLLATYRAAVRQ